VKFTDEGSVVVEVSYTYPTLTISVRDTGIGVPAEKHKAIFAPFTQADGSTSRRFGGTGLGLAISRRLVTLMEGRIWVEDNTKTTQGAVFSFAIPCKPATAQPATPDLQGTRILLMEPMAEARDYLAEALRSWNCEVTVAMNRSEALVAANSNSDYDVALLGTGGEDLASVVRPLRECHLHVEVFWMAPAADRRAREEAKQVRARGVLARPVRRGRLATALKQALAYSDPALPALNPRFDHGMSARHPLRILLVEDNKLNRDVAVAMLQRLGYRPDVAMDGREAVDRCSSSRYDLVLMDVQMPGLDGVSATRYLHTLPPAEQPGRIVAFTANVMEAQQDEYLAAGMDGVLEKPVRVEALIEVLQGRTDADAVRVTRPLVRRSVQVGAYDRSALMKLAELCEGDMDMLRTMVESFIQGARSSVEELSKALAASDVAAARLTAHSLKSASAQYGAVAVSEVCRKVEGAAERGDVARAIGLKATLNRRVIESHGWMLKVLRGLEELYVAKRP